MEMTNGGTYYQGQVLLVQSGRAHEHAPNLALVSTQPPHEARIILDNYFGRQFNSLNDATVHPTSKAIFVTDPTYGFVVGFRPKPQVNAIFFWEGTERLLTFCLRCLFMYTASTPGQVTSASSRTDSTSPTASHFPLMAGLPTCK
jgi:hypothetical protein